MVAVQEYPRFRRHAVQYNGAVRGDDYLQLLAQSAALQFEHRLLLGVGVQTRIHLIDQHQCVFETGYVLRYADDGPFSGGHVELGVACVPCTFDLREQ